MFETCYLHIGQPKTGSGSIQRSFHHNRDLLEANGLHYPGASHNHFLLGSATYENPAPVRYFQRQGKTTDDMRKAAAGFAETVRREAEISTAQALMLSSERFFNLPPANLRRLMEFAATLARDTVVVCYIRHPALHAVSAVQQGIKMGHGTLASQNPRSGAQLIARLNDLRAQVPKSKLLLRPFDPAQLAGGDAIQDMLKVVGLERLIGEGFEYRANNESLSYEAVLLGDAANRILPGVVEGKWNPERVHNLHRFLLAIGGERFSLPETSMAEIERETAPAVEVLSQEYGLSFSARETRPSAPKWDAETLEDIIREVNALMLERHRLRERIAQLGRSAAKKTPRRRWWRGGG